ncbi:MAG: hypothetical protein KAU94_01310 [Verrucomicrobia bacterium]|nr:hypothetical protein [Verrucomicrobiota bacterium]
MTLQWIAIIIGILATAGGLVGVLRPESVKRFAELFPRSIVPAWIFTALCCWLGAKEALGMNMGFLDAYKKYIYLISPAVFIASVVYMKELLAPRALGGFLLLIAVPILQIARWHESPLRLVVVVLVYLWIVYGLVLLMSPWYFRKMSALFMGNDSRFKAIAYAKTALGVAFLLLGIFVY